MQKCFGMRLENSWFLSNTLTGARPHRRVKVFTVVDPADNNKVRRWHVARRPPRASLHGLHDSGWLYFSMPAPNRGELLREIQGWLAKIDTDTWKVVQSLPMQHYPLWTVFFHGR